MTFSHEALELRISAQIRFESQLGLRCKILVAPNASCLPQQLSARYRQVVQLRLATKHYLEQFYCRGEVK